MKLSIASVGAALALLAGCGGGSDKTVQAASSPTPSATESATAGPSADATDSAMPSTSSTPSRARLASPRPTSTASASGDALPIQPLLPEHKAGDAFPAAQLTSAFSGDVIVDC